MKLQTAAIVSLSACMLFAAARSVDLASAGTTMHLNLFVSAADAVAATTNTTTTAAVK